MQILLIWPESNSPVLNDSLSCCEPLPLEYLAGALRGAHDVRIFDGRLDGNLEEFAAGFEPGMIGVAVPYTSGLRSSRAAARKARALWPSVPIVLGGHHVTMSSQWIEDDFAADYIFVGEAFMSIAEIARRIERGLDLSDIPNLIPFSERHRAKPALLAADFNGEVMPDRSVLARHRGRYFHSIYRPVALMRFSAGCPFECNFCSLWKLTGRRYIVKSVDRVLNELAEIEVDNIYVVDDEAFIQPNRMEILADAIARSGFQKKFHMYLRSDTAVRNASIIEKWAEIGLDSVLVGAESSDEDELDDYQKGISADKTREAVQIFHQNGVKVRANFIVRPDFKEPDFLRVREDVRVLGIDMPSLSVLTPLPGTDLHQDSCSNLISDNPDLYDCYHTLLPTALPLERFYEELSNLMRDICATNASGAPAPMFYFSSDDAFSRMVKSVREGASLHSLQY